MKNYTDYKNILKGIDFPYVVLDKDLFNKNIEINLKRAGNKKIRLASKSLRCVKTMRMILDYNSQLQGIMTYHGKEVLYLAKQGFNNLLMGYPIVSKPLIEEITKLLQKGKQIYFMIDSLEHLTILNEIGKQQKIKIPICIDFDLSDNYPGLRFGVWRSSISNITELELLLKNIKKLDFITLKGLMGYEAQIAGVADKIKGNLFKSSIIRNLKSKSVKSLTKKRKLAIDLIDSEGFNLEFVNGGGTGSLETTTKENVVTEVTVGSGFYNAHLFDNYKNFELHPAMFYGIEIVRKPNENIFTCHGGGFIASGNTDKTKAPIVHLPKHGFLDKLEGAGEVQTPIRFTNLTEKLKIGDPIFLRHAKSGELCERINKIMIIEKDKIHEVNTYRGDNYNFG